MEEEEGDDKYRKERERHGEREGDTGPTFYYCIMLNILCIKI